MNDRQQQDRTKSLQSALGRMSEARKARTGEVAVLDIGADDFAQGELRSRRRRFFSFGDRARSAVLDDE